MKTSRVSSVKAYILPAWTTGHLDTAFYLQAAVLDKGYYDFGLLRPVGQDLGGFIKRFLSSSLYDI
ncbi:hypothetical protein Holit_01040 [Hollandina sp. SP2]